MDKNAIPEEIQKFILMAIPSISHLEALLLLRHDPEQEWDAQGVARRLYTNPATAYEVLTDLLETGFVVEKNANSGRYCYRPNSPELSERMDGLAIVYAKNLIAVTQLIHARGKMKPQKFADAFIIGKG